MVTLSSLPMGASRNQGNSANGRKYSPCGSSSQKPWTDTLVTSAAEVTVPGAADDIFVLSDQLQRDVDLVRRQAIALRKLNSRLKPELCFSAGRLYMHVHPCLFARKEEQAKSLRA